MVYQWWNITLKTGHRHQDIVTSLSILVTRRATRPGIASKSSQKLNQDIAVRVDGKRLYQMVTNLPLKRKKTTNFERFPIRIILKFYCYFSFPNLSLFFTYYVSLNFLGTCFSIKNTFNND